MAIVIAAWGWGYQKPAHHPPLAGPWSLEFWDLLLSLIAFGFGGTSRSTAFAIICLLVVILPLMGYPMISRGRLAAGDSAVYAMVLGTIAVLVIVAMGRAGTRSIPYLQPRYFEMAMLLAPLSGALWSMCLQRPLQRAVVIGLLWVFLCVSFSPSPSQFEGYADSHHRRSRGLDLIRGYYELGGDGDFPSLYPHPLAEPLDNARKLRLSFTRSIAADP